MISNEKASTIKKGDRNNYKEIKTELKCKVCVGVMLVLSDELIAVNAAPKPLPTELLGWVVI